MMKKFYILFALSIPLTCLKAQLKTGDNPGVLHSSAVLEAESTTKGILIPRMTTAQMNAIATPALGLMVFNTDLNCLHFYFSGWKSQCDPANVGAWSLLGNTGTTAGTNFLGTTDAQDLVFKTNNTEGMRLATNGRLGINTSVPTSAITVINKNGNDQADDIEIRTFTNSSETPSFLYRKAKGTQSSPLSLGNSEYIGGIDGYAYDGTAYIRAGGVNTFTSSTFTTDGGTVLRLGTSKNGTYTQQVHLDENGNLGINANTPQYKLDIVGSNPVRLIGLNAGAITDSIVSSNNGILRRLSIADIIASGSNAWALTGNGGTF
jgi:hypothetical protein